MDSKELDIMLEAAKGHVMTPRELWMQRVSFVCAQLMESNVTREQVEASAVKTYGPCPTIEPNDDDYDDMHHALGRPSSHNLDSAYRNHYCTNALGGTAQRFDALGCWNFVKYINEHLGAQKDAIYSVNSEGIAALTKWLQVKEDNDAAG